MAAKRARKPSPHPLLAVALGLAIAALAALALLSDGRLFTRSPRAPEAVAVAGPEPRKETTAQNAQDHDRDQIDQASRERLREILRASSSEE